MTKTNAHTQMALIDQSLHHTHLPTAAASTANPSNPFFLLPLLSPFIPPNPSTNPNVHHRTPSCLPLRGLLAIYLRLILPLLLRRRRWLR